MIKRIKKIICWPFKKILDWLASGLPGDKVEKDPPLELHEEVPVVEPEKIQCNTHSRFKKSCPICVEAAK